jgi:hypothetical protein
VNPGVPFEQGLWVPGTLSSHFAQVQPDKQLLASLWCINLPHNLELTKNVPFTLFRTHDLQDGMCVVTSQVLTVPAGDPKSCRGSKTSTAVLLRFPCTEEPRQKQASGPALNLWGSFDGIPTPTRSGVVVTEAGAAPAKHSLHATKLSGHSASRTSATNPNGYVVSGTSGAATPAGYVVSSTNSGAAAPEGYVVSGAAPNGYVVSNTDTPATTAGYVVSGTPASTSGYVVSSTNANTSSSSGTGACSFLTINPGLYYHKTPPMFTYGYVVSGVPCERAQSALAATTALERAGARTFPTTYSLWMKPTLPAVSLAHRAALWCSRLRIDLG